MPKKTYHEPRIESEKCFETMALSCVKVLGDNLCFYLATAIS
jgi:hypothetical protein